MDMSFEPSYFWVHRVESTLSDKTLVPYQYTQGRYKYGDCDFCIYQIKTMCALTAAYQPACPCYNLVPSQAQKQNRLMPGLQAFLLHMECISWPVLSKVQQIFNNEKTIWIKHYLDTRDAKCGTCCLWHFRPKTTFTFKYATDNSARQYEDSKNTNASEVGLSCAGHIQI